MKPMTDKARARVFGMSFASLYRLYLIKIERKGRTKEELDEVLRWLTLYTQKQLQALIEKGTNLGDFLTYAKMNPDRKKVTGLICGIRVEDIKEPTEQDMRYMDKVVDDLAKGKSMEKVLRKE